MDLEVTGEVWYWRGPAPFHFVTVPAEEAAEIHAVARDVTYGWGVIPVTVRLGGTTWTTSLFPKDGGYLLPLKDAVRRAEDVELGDVVSAVLTLDLRTGRRV
ncbi:DUF1905 domain-containing protein [Thalassiella azotivora]